MSFWTQQRLEQFQRQVKGSDGFGFNYWGSGDGLGHFEVIGGRALGDLGWIGRPGFEQGGFGGRFRLFRRSLRGGILGSDSIQTTDFW